jgi:hypothetical protein
MVNAERIYERKKNAVLNGPFLCIINSLDTKEHNYLFYYIGVKKCKKRVYK